MKNVKFQSLVFRNVQFQHLFWRLSRYEAVIPFIDLPLYMNIKGRRAIKRPRYSVPYDHLPAPTWTTGSGNILIEIQMKRRVSSLVVFQKRQKTQGNIPAIECGTLGTN